MRLDKPAKFRVDATDIEILRALGRGGSGRVGSPKATIEEVAIELALHPNTVFGRVKRMQEGGLFTRFTVLPEPNALGLSLGHYHLELPMSQRTHALIDEVLQLGCIFLIIESVEGWDIAPIARDEAALDALAERIRAHVGAPPGSWSMRSSLDWPHPPRVELDEIDLAIFEAVLSNAHAPMEELAAKLGLSARTVQRHHEKLRDAGTLRVYPNFEAIFTGLAFRHVQFDLPPPGPAREHAERALEQMMPNTLFRQVIGRGVQYFLFGDEHGELQAQVEQGAGVPGVSIAYNTTMRRTIYSPYYAAQMLALLREAFAPAPR